jgi:cysteinyl-tRNA synthetase
LPTHDLFSKILHTRWPRDLQLLSNSIEAFEPGNEVSVYACGITPYDTTHLGAPLPVGGYAIRFLGTGPAGTLRANVTDIGDDI